MQDILDVKSGELIAFLEKTLATFEDHIRDCVLCTAKGFFCELCDNKSDTSSARRCVIFPFDDDSSSCPDCNGVFHRGCFLQNETGGECPRCDRRRRKKALQEQKTAAAAVNVDEEVIEATIFDEALVRRGSARES